MYGGVSESGGRREQKMGSDRRQQTGEKSKAGSTTGGELACDLRRAKPRWAIATPLRVLLKKEAVWGEDDAAADESAPVTVRGSPAHAGSAVGHPEV